MKRKLISAVVILCLSISLAPASLAQDESDAGNPETNIADIMGVFNSQNLHDQLTTLGLQMVDSWLDFFAKPSTAEKIATFQKNYYDALIEKGFTEEQAFQLLLNVGNPLSSLGGQKTQ